MKQRRKNYRSGASGRSGRKQDHLQSPAPKPTQPLSVRIEKPIYGGAFLARVEGKAVFVPLTLPGEEASIRILDEKRGYATAEADQILTRAPERTQPPCPYFGPCGGCQYQHVNYTAQLDIKQNILHETLERAGAAAPAQVEIISGEPWAYRNRIRLAFDSQGRPGYRARQSHEVIPIDQCPISAPVLIRAATVFAQIVRTIAPQFRPADLALFCNHDESALLVSVFAAQPAKIPLEAMASAIKAEVPALAGMELVLEGRPGQPPRTIAQWGEASLAYQAAGFAYRVDHGAFFQVNRWLVDALVYRVTAGPTGRFAWDLFAGVGLFSRRLASSFDRVIAVESAPAAMDALTMNLSGTSASSLRSTTVDFLRRHRIAEKPDFIVLDPPRTGLGPETTAFLNEIAAPAITYVSCDPATLARDLRALMTGGYRIRRLTLADLFPQTFHLETIAELQLA